MCCLSCLPICTSSVRTLSVNFLFVTSSCSCRKSLCWIGCCLLLPHLSFSSNSWWRWDCDDKTAQKPPQQRWWDCNVGASAISFDFAAQPPWRWWWQRVGDLLEFLTVARLRWRDCAATSSMIGGPVEKMSFFKMSIWQKWVLRSTHLFQYDVYKVSSKKNDHNLTVGCLNLMLILSNYMHMGPKKYGQCPNVWVEDACKVLRSGFNV